jgi:hypothetical protein
MSFNPPLALLPMLQLLHAFSFGATHSLNQGHDGVRQPC